MNVFVRVTNFIPLYTFCFCLCLSLLFLIPDSFNWLYFDRSAVVEGGQWWRLVTSQFVHLDAKHFSYNIIALGVLGFFWERESAYSPLVVLCFAVLVIGIQLPVSPLDSFCGFSGAVNALVVPVTYYLWRSSGSYIVPVLGGLHVLRVVVEYLLGEPIATDMVWPSYAPSHLLGLLVGCLWLFYDLRGRAAFRTLIGRFYMR